MVCNKDNIIIISPKLLMRGPAYGCEEKTKDDWLHCEKGHNLSVFGFDDWLLLETKGTDFELYNNNDRLARCSITNNQIAVVFEDNINDYNPYFKKWFEEHPFKAIRIPEFDGSIYIEGDKIVGKKDGLVFESYIINEDV